MRRLPLLAELTRIAVGVGAVLATPRRGSRPRITRGPLGQPGHAPAPPVGDSCAADPAGPGCAPPPAAEPEAP